MVVLFIEGWGIGKKRVPKSTREEVPDDEAEHKSDEARRHDGGQQGLRAVNVAVRRLHRQQIYTNTTKEWLLMTFRHDISQSIPFRLYGFYKAFDS